MDFTRDLCFASILCLIITTNVLFAQRSIDNTNKMTNVKIGGIFESGQDELVEAFEDAIQRVNNDRNLMSKFKLVARIERVKAHDSFHATKLICNNLVREGALALVGPESPSIEWLLRSMANNLHLPHFSVFWDYRSYQKPQTNLYDSSASNFTLSLYPEASVLSKAFMDLVLSRNWKSFTLIFEQNDGLIKLKDLLRISSYSDMRKVKMSILQYDSNFQYETIFQYKKILKDIKKSEHNIVLSISNDKVVEFLRQAAQMKRLTEYDNYLIASLDIHALNLSEFQYTQTNITGLSLLDPKGQEIGFVTRDWITGKMVSSIKRVVSTTTALLHDSVTLFAKGLEDFHRNSKQSIISSPISCEKGNPLPYGTALINSIKTINIMGMSGPLELDKDGQRTQFELNILELKKNGFEKIAKWTKSDGIKTTTNYTSVYRQVLEIMKEKVLKVTVPKNVRPYIFLKENHESLEGNDKFDGYCVDLLNEISKVFENEFKSKFLFEIHIVADEAYGKQDPETGEWTGMIGELLRHQSDLAVADLTATWAREKAVDFTMPFMNLGISILFKKPGLPEPELFSFLKPFSVEVWLYLASAYLSISLLLWILSRISPYEWVSGHPCEPEPEELENQFSIGNSLWFTIGSLMQQGSDLAPRALSTRTLASIWWFFTLIMISSYTANLAASLTLSRMAPAISNVEDLAKQTVIQYGCKKDGSTYDFFKYSNHSTYQRMFNTMETNPEVYIQEVSQAKERVKKGGYAYLMESSSLDYEVQRDCDLIEIGNWLDNKGYGIACPPDSPYRTPISNAIVVLQDRGLLYELKKRWWEDKGGGLCGVETKPTSASELNIENVGGVFVVLVTGVGIGCVFAALEFVWKSMKVSRHERDSILKLIWLEIVRIFTGGGSSRPAPSNKNNTKSSIDSDSVRELESMAEMNNKLMVRLTPNNINSHQIIY